MKEERLKEIEERLSRLALLPAPWDYFGYRKKKYRVYDYRHTPVATVLAQEDSGASVAEVAEFIACARQDVADLLAEVRRLQAELDGHRILKGNRALDITFWPLEPLDMLLRPEEKPNINLWRY